MSIRAINASSAYDSTSKLSGVQPQEISTLSFKSALEEAKLAMNNTSFLNVSSNHNTESNISRLLSNTFDQINISEQVNSQALNGQASTADVVTNITKAETAMQTLVSFRDKFMNSLQDLLKMSI